MGKILAAAPATIPIRIDPEDRFSITITEEINKSIKSAARCITRTKLSDKIQSDSILSKAGLQCLNKAVHCKYIQCKKYRFYMCPSVVF